MLSTPILTAVRAWIEADGIDWESYRAVMRPWVAQAYDVHGGPNPIHALERGECSGAKFEEILAARLLRLDGAAVVADDLLRRMFAAMLPVPAMYDTIRTLRVAGFQHRVAFQLLGVRGTRARTSPGCSTPWCCPARSACGPERRSSCAAQTPRPAPEECVFIDDMAASTWPRPGLRHDRRAAERDRQPRQGAAGPARRPPGLECPRTLMGLAT